MEATRSRSLSLNEARQQTVDTLCAAGFGAEEAQREARLLIEIATGMDRLRQLASPETIMDAVQAIQLHLLTARRAECEPMAHLAGFKEFYGRNFAVSPATLIPRPDSEILVEAALFLIPEPAPARLLDLGTGTGCLLLSVLAERPHAQGTGVDIEPAATALATRNAEALALTEYASFYTGSWFAPLPENAAPFDVILANPPYISTAEMQRLMPDVRDYEPGSALHGGVDGLSPYRAILAEAPKRLVAGGAILLEIGHTQSAQVEALGKAAGLLHAATLRDLAGHDRVVAFRAPGKHDFLNEHSPHLSQF